MHETDSVHERRCRPRDRLGHPRREHAGVDGAEDAHLHGHPRQHGEVEDVADLLLRERSILLFDEHHPCCPRERGCAKRVPDCEIAAAHDDDGDVGDLHDCSGGRVGRVAAVDDRGRRAVAQYNRQSRARLCDGDGCERALGTSTRQERDPGRGLDREPVERLARRFGAGVQPVDEPDRRLGTQPEDGGMVAVEVGEPGRAGFPGDDERAGGREH